MGEAGWSYLEGRFVALHGPHVYHPWSRESYYESHYLHCGCKWLIKLISLLARRAYSHIKIHSKGTKNHFWRIFLFQSQYDINTTKWMWTLSVQEFKDENKGTPFFQRLLNSNTWNTKDKSVLFWSLSLSLLRQSADLCSPAETDGSNWFPECFAGLEAPWWPVGWAKRGMA